MIWRYKMDYSTLEELMAIQKKTESSQVKKTLFKKEMKQLLYEEGFTIQAEEYIFRGFSFGGADVVLDFMKSKPIEEQKSIFNAVVNGVLYKGNDKGISFKFLIALLGALINDNDEHIEIIEEVIKCSLKKSRNKEQMLFKDASSTVEKYLVCAISSDAVLPDLSKMLIKPFTITCFKSLISELIQPIRVSKSNDIKTLEKIKLWVASTDDKVETINSDHRPIAKSSDMEEASTKTNTKNKHSSKPEQLREIADYLDNIEKNKSKAVNELLKLELDKAKLEKKIEQIEQEFQILQIKLKDTLEQKEQLYSDTILKKSEIEERNKEVMELKSEIKKRDAVLSVFEAEKNSSQQEQLKSIASKLKIDYRDFIDAIDMEMTIDLGENLRQQLLQVFKTLKKNGIEIQER